MFKAFDENNQSVWIENAVSGKHYFCPMCAQPVFQKRGSERSPHFAHFPSNAKYQYIKCVDSWTYDMTDWHREWQERFPEECREVVVSDKSGKKHYADVLINDTVIEFQHSSLSIDEFRDRNSFYTEAGYKVVWLFDISKEYIDGGYQHKYTYSGIRTPLGKLDIKQEEAEIYVQFDDYKECIERMVYNGDHYFKTGNPCFSIQDFISTAKDNIQKLLPYHEPDLSNKPELVAEVQGNTIEELWNSKYQFMVVGNKYTNQAMFIFGRNGVLQTNDYGQPEGYYAYYDKAWRYKSKKYAVKNAYLPIWKLVHFKERDFEKEKQVQEETQRRIREENEKNQAQKIAKIKTEIESQKIDNKIIETVGKIFPNDTPISVRYGYLNEFEGIPENADEMIKAAEKIVENLPAAVRVGLQYEKLLKTAREKFDAFRMQEQIKKEQRASEISFYFNHPEIFEQEAVINAPIHGRLIKCKKCGHIGTEENFISYGGKGQVNFGVCYDCRDKI